MKLFILSLLCIVSIHSLSQEFFINEELNNDWETYKIKYGKKYEPLNEVSRRIIWEQNLKYIRQHNLEYDLGNHTYYLGINQFADMTHEEFKEKYLGLGPMDKNDNSSIFMAPENMGQIPPSVDWRTKGYVTSVKNQLHCGSCWAFSATGSLEGQYFRKTRSLVSFSEQQLVDCSRPFGNYGCRGGLPSNAYRYVHMFGIESEASYPYVAMDRICTYSAGRVVTHCSGMISIRSGDENNLAYAVATVGPISVAIDASHPSFSFYKGGVYNEVRCSPTTLNHAVLVVGYGTTIGRNYWIVKNSWGTTWGMGGYIQMSKDRGNQCGIASVANYPVI